MKSILQAIKEFITRNDSAIESDDVLSQEQLKRIKQVRDQLREVEKNPLRTWIENFKKDSNPDSEIAIWECIAETYSAFIAGKSLSRKQKEEIFTYSLSCSFTQDLSRLENETPKHIPADWVKHITATFRTIVNERFPKNG